VGKLGEFRTPGWSEQTLTDLRVGDGKYLDNFPRLGFEALGGHTYNGCRFADHGGGYAFGDLLALT